MNQVAEKRLRTWERVFCVLLIGWLQVVGVRTNSIVHHLLHAAPLVVLLFVRPGAARHFTGLLAGYLWVFMLAAVSPMLHNTFVRGYIFIHPEIHYTWLAPIAAILATTWAATNAALLARRPQWLMFGLIIGIALIGLLAWAHPYLSHAFNFPLDRTLAGQYAWAIVLLFETAVVLALPAWYAFRISAELKITRRFLGGQCAYWTFFVAAMVAGLIPVVNR